MPKVCALDAIWWGATAQVRVTGLQGVAYTDSLQGGVRLTEAGEAVVFGEEVDRVYLAAPGTIRVGAGWQWCGW